MNDIIENFYKACWQSDRRSVYREEVPSEMIVSPADKSGWFEWRPIKGDFSHELYRQLEVEFGIKLPDVFIEWHRRYFFLDCGCSLVGLPYSLPSEPLKDIRNNLDWFVPEQIIPQGLVPFADEGNDTGPLVFDTRNQIGQSDFPIRVYDHEYGGDLEGLSDVVFSSFSKLLECLTYYINETKIRNSFDVIPEFFNIDPEGAGSSGKAYWTQWIEMERANFEEFGY